MQFHFFEEFPSEETFSKAVWVDFPSTVYIAAPSFSEFLQAEALLQTYNPSLQSAFWPLLNTSYWFSPFAQHDELQEMAHVFQEARKNRDIGILLDLELPLLLPKLFWKHLSFFARNKKLLVNMVEHLSGTEGDLLTAEYPVSNRLLFWILQQLGISYLPHQRPHKKVVMYYTSMIPYPWIKKRIQKNLAKQVQKWGNHFCVGVGTIATGIFGTEPILPPEALYEDLSFLREIGVKEVYLFRLGGMNQEYRDVLDVFLDKNVTQESLR